MATSQLVSVEEYLHSTFETDAEYVDGKIVNRSAPLKPHSKMQGYLVRALYEIGHPNGYKTWVEQRIRTKSNPARYRVPDICVTVGEPNEDIFTTPPFLCIESLSPDDSALEVRSKVAEYLTFGVSYVWVIDPISCGGEIHTSDRIERVRDRRFKAESIEVRIPDPLQ
jgi:Uma2 family endonuclease